VDANKKERRDKDTAMFSGSGQAVIDTVLPGHRKSAMPVPAAA
jgi:hypothetical protein